VTGVAEDRITLVGRPGCHLCDAAREVVERVAADTGTGWREVSVAEDAQLAEKYAELIPVIVVDGAPLDVFRADEQRLRDALAGRRGWLRRPRAASG
jgi:hypothetical protein